MKGIRGTKENKVVNYNKTIITENLPKININIVFKKIVYTFPVAQKYKRKCTILTNHIRNHFVRRDVFLLSLNFEPPKIISNRI